MEICSGGGIVVDSDLVVEYEEMLVKVFVLKVVLGVSEC